MNSGALDQMEAVAPDHHIYTDSQVKWLVLNDNLPGHKSGREI